MIIEALVAEGMLAQSDLALFDYADSVEEAWAKLVQQGLGRHGSSPP
jgi:hypothetical protein